MLKMITLFGRTGYRKIFSTKLGVDYSRNRKNETIAFTIYGGFAPYGTEESKNILLYKKYELYKTIKYDNITPNVILKDITPEVPNIINCFGVIENNELTIYANQLFVTSGNLTVIFDKVDIPSDLTLYDCDPNSFQKSQFENIIEPSFLPSVNSQINVGISQGFTLSTTDFETIPLDNIIVENDDTSIMSLQNNGIKVNKLGFLKVSGIIYIGNVQDGDHLIARIYDGNTVVENIDIYARSSICGIALPSVLVKHRNVNSNLTLQLKNATSARGSVNQNTFNTHLCVETVSH